MRFKMDREFYTSSYKKIDPADYEGEVEGFEAYEKDFGSKVAGMVFLGKQQKPAWHYSYSSRMSLMQKVRESRDGWLATQKFKADQRDAKKNFQHSVKVGDIFGTSWGYEQTNREFYQVVEVKGKSVMLREIAQEGGRDDDPGFGPMAGTTRYVKDHFIGEPFRKLVLHDNSIHFESYRSGFLVTDAQNEKGFYVSWGH